MAICFMTLSRLISFRVNPHSVVVLDNCTNHCTEVVATLRVRGSIGALILQISILLKRLFLR